MALTEDGPILDVTKSYQYAPYLYKRKEGSACSQYMFWWFIYLIYIYIKVCLFLDFLIYEILEE